MEYFVKNDDNVSFENLRSLLSDNTKIIDIKSFLQKFDFSNPQNKLSLEFRVSKLAAMINLTNTFMEKDFIEIWKLLNDYINDVNASNRILVHPDIDHIIDILNIFSHYDITTNSIYLNENLSSFKSSMRNFFSHFSIRVDKNIHYLRYGRCLLSLNCFDAKLFEYLLSDNFEKDLVGMFVLN